MGKRDAGSVCRCGYLSLMLREGLKTEEVLNLKMGDVDMSRFTVCIIPKRGFRRHLSLTYETAAALRLWLGHRARLAPACDAFFTTKRGRPLYLRELLAAMRCVGEEAGIPRQKQVPSTLRHTYATEFLRGGGNAALLASLMGLSRRDQTGKYVHALRRQEG